jgi:ornithine decarboxylase
MTNADMTLAFAPSAPIAKPFAQSVASLPSQMDQSFQSSVTPPYSRIGRETVGWELKHRLRQFKQQQANFDADVEEDIEYSFFIADLGEVYRQFIRWKRNLPRVEPFYAVKCNPDPTVIRLLGSLGAGFDCASKDEIGKILSLVPNIPHRNIIFANPCKANPQIRYAQSVDVKMMTFDNADELHKCKQHYPNAQLLLRIWTDDSKSQCQLSRKFGAPEEAIRPLLKLASLLSLNVIGVSFHVGSGSHDPDAFVSSVDMAKKAFDIGRDLGFDFSILDVGGGFCHDDFESLAAILGQKIDEQFPEEMGVRIIAEPGRYFVASAFTLATNVIARRVGFATEKNPDKSYMCTFPSLQNLTIDYLSDGVYGSFNCILYDHQNPIPKLLSHEGRVCYDSPDRYTKSHNEVYKCSIWGPTCDGLDCIAPSFEFPVVLEVGDWLYFEDMGAYTICAATRFNGFRASDVFYVTSEPCIAMFLE